jgi:hypothetical protein
MSHHLFILSPSDTPIYSFIHYSTKSAPNVSSPLASNLPTWSTSAFAGTLTALSGASSATSHHVQGGARMGGGQDRHVIQMIANASLDVVEDVMRKDNAMFVRRCHHRNDEPSLNIITGSGTSKRWINSTSGPSRSLSRRRVSRGDIDSLEAAEGALKMSSSFCCTRRRTTMGSKHSSLMSGSCMSRFVHERQQPIDAMAD